MSFLNDPEVKRILDTARVMSRREREEAITKEISRLGGGDVLQFNLQNTFHVDSLSQIDDEDFDLAALIAWKLIYRLRASSGALH
ncbi:hypothetical protein [Roseibium sp.]|uniref:hypothetical protein n=1 Tax=Roseibium sp. TaxID=1936156 RepID=UPI003A983450